MRKITLRAIEGNTQRLDGGAMFGNAPRAMWETWIKPDEQGRIPLNCRAMLIECEGKRLLCETGVGAFFPPNMAQRYGVVESEHMLLKNLESLGLTDADIDFVVLSHLHFDHAGGLLPAYDASVTELPRRLLFPNAKYVVGATAFERSVRPHPRDRASFITGLSDALQASGRLILVDELGRGADELHQTFANRTSFIFTNGHTPGQMHLVFKGDKRTVAFAGDLVPGTTWIHVPLTMGYDRFAEQVIDEKASLYATAVPQRWFLFYTHDVQHMCSQVEQDGKGRFVAANPHLPSEQLEL